MPPAARSLLVVAVVILLAGVITLGVRVTVDDPIDPTPPVASPTPDPASPTPEPSPDPASPTPEPTPDPTPSPEPTPTPAPTSDPGRPPTAIDELPQTGGGPVAVVAGLLALAGGAALGRRR